MRKNDFTEEKLLELAKESARLVNEKKGENIVLLDLKDVNSYFDYFLICTGNSHVHLRAMSRELTNFFSSKQRNIRNRPDLETGWILLDYGDIVIHLFTSAARQYYQLEKLWADASIVPVQ